MTEFECAPLQNRLLFQCVSFFFLQYGDSSIRTSSAYGICPVLNFNMQKKGVKYDHLRNRIGRRGKNMMIDETIIIVYYYYFTINIFFSIDIFCNESYCFCFIIGGNKHENNKEFLYIGRRYGR